MKAAIVGVGRMGRAVEQVLVDRGHDVAARVDVEGDEQGRTLVEAIRAVSPDVAIEFSVPGAAESNVRTLVELGTPVVCGTTGWNTGDVAAIAQQHGTPVIIASNFSVGIAVMNKVLAQAAALLRAFPDFEPALVERHHSAKQDAPSGTAKMLAHTVEAAGGRGRMPVASVRQGGQPGEHTVIFEGEAETLAVTHQARSRRIFAAGAVQAAEWLVQERPHGLVTFDAFLERIGTWRQD